MKYLFLLFFILSTQNVSAVELCCFCVADLNDKEFTTDECQKWINKNDCSNNSIINKVNPLKFKTIKLNPDAIVCESMKVYGSFHGHTTYHQVPFDIITHIIEAYKPKVIDYSGSSCLIFNEIDDVELNAVDLANKFPDVKINIAGNQNVGVVRFSYFTKPKEINHMSSKMFVEIDNGQVKTNFAQCSKQDKSCSIHQDSDFSDKVESGNTKFCMSQSGLSTQTCCPKKAYQVSGYGKWNQPNTSCN